MIAGEGCASIADQSGNLLFYTNGVDIFNNQHLPMANSSGINGYQSSTQSAVIVKKPGSSDLYYVFSQQGVGGGLWYSIVDMSLASGTGSVIIKNVLMFTSTFGMTEKLTAALHCNGMDVWILGHDFESFNFRAFLLSSAGVNLTPVISSVGIYHGWQNWAGDLKVSPNGKKLGVVIPTVVTQILDFDPSSGLVSNPLSLGPGSDKAYGCEFSPDGTKFYTSHQNGIWQWNLCAGSNAAILASVDSIIDVQAQLGNTLIGELQLGPDGKIYVARQGFTNALGVINNPNTNAAFCNYVASGISVAPNAPFWGLPNFSGTLFRQLPVPFTFTTNCQTASFNTNNGSSASGGCSNILMPNQSFLWNFGDPSSGAANTSTLSNPDHTFTSAGTYSVQLIIIASACYADTLKQTITVQPAITLSVSSTPASCYSAGSATVIAMGSSGPYYYLWSSGETTSIAHNLNPGMYSINVNQSGNCSVSTSVSISLQNTLNGTVTALSIPCANGGFTGGAAVLLSGAPSPFTYYWSGSSKTTPTVSGLAEGIHTLTVSDGLNFCTRSFTFQITLQNGPVTILPPVKVCANAPFTLSSPVNGLNYLWSGPGKFSSEQMNVIITNALPAMAGSYTVKVSDTDNCLVTFIKPVSVDPLPSVKVSVTKNNLCVPYCSELKTEILNAGVPIVQSDFQINEQQIPPPSYLYCFNVPGEFVVTSTCKDANGCSNSSALKITAYPKPIADFQYVPQTPLANVDEVVFINQTLGVQQTNWSWFIADKTKPISNKEQASWLFKNEGIKAIAMVVKNVWGCADTVVKSVTVLEEFCIYIPNSFTPDGNGKNDVFMPKGAGIKLYNLMIFDRWGKMLFQSTDGQDGWDGTFEGVKCKTDIYVWKMSIRSTDGQLKQRIGHLTLLR